MRMLVKNLLLYYVFYSAGVLLLWLAFLCGREEPRLTMPEVSWTSSGIALALMSVVWTCQARLGLAQRQARLADLQMQLYRNDLAVCYREATQDHDTSDDAMPLGMHSPGWVLRQIIRSQRTQRDTLRLHLNLQNFRAETAPLPAPPLGPRRLHSSRSKSP